MKLSDFDYKFPEELVAQHPLPERTSSKMMFLDREKKAWKHACVNDFPFMLMSGDVLALNDSKVIPARIFGEKMGGKIMELLLSQRIKGSEKSAEQWKCVTKRVRNYRAGEKIFFGISATAKVLGRDGDYLVIEFPKGHRERAVKKRGVPPLPPYIKRQDFNSYSDEDRKRYQTIYAKENGSIAAPTAGLHFSLDLLKKIEEQNVKIVYVSLHVGADTFAPVRTEDINDHKMHGETFWVSKETADVINKAKKENRRIIAVGTTTVRALESSVEDNIVRAGQKDTNLFIKPGYEFKIVDALLTNFHQPKSTLLMLVSAFAGREFIFKAYEEAIKNNYRLFSYGDCMLII